MVTGKWYRRYIQSWDIDVVTFCYEVAKHILQCEHYNEAFSKESFIDTSLEKLKAIDKNEQNIFLMQELENMLLECKNLSDYIMDLFVKDLLLEDFCTEKNQYRRRKNILLAYRGFFFLSKEDLKFL